MTLREEISALETKALQSHIIHPQTAYRQGILDALAIIDRHEDARKEFGDTRCRTCLKDAPAYCIQCWERRSKPSEERPVRERLKKWASDARNGSKPVYVNAIIEALDALTAAMREKP